MVSAVIIAVISRKVVKLGVINRTISGKNQSMDKFDRQILDILKINARCSVSDIARDVSRIPRSTVNYQNQKARK